MSGWDPSNLPPRFRKRAVAVIETLLSGSSDEIIARFAKYAEDPIAFCREELGFIPWESDDPKKHSQADLIRAVLKFRRIACKSGHKIGKSITAVALALWFVCTRSNARVILAAPAFHQIKNILWKEMRNIFRNNPELKRKLGAEPAIDPGTGLKLGNGNEIFGVSAATKENMAGLSSPEMLIIIDEGSGFPDDLWNALSKGNAAGGVTIFVISNPTRTSGWFYDLFRRKLARWALFTISSETTPNARSGKKLVPGLAEADFIEEMREICGGYELDENGIPAYARDAEYQVRVEGSFPSQGSDSVVPAVLVDRAIARWSKEPSRLDVDLTFGVDVGRYGKDPSVVQPVRGTYAYMPRHVFSADGNQVANLIVQTFHALRLGNERVRVNVDGIGVGASVVDALKKTDEAKAGLIVVVEINVGESADVDPKREADDSKVTKTHYANLRSQVWFGVTEWLKQPGAALPDYEELNRELLAATYTIDLKNRKQVMRKEIMKEVLGRSPDFADALCLAVYRGQKGVWFDMSDPIVTKAVFGASVTPKIAAGSYSQVSSTLASDYYRDD